MNPLESQLFSSSSGLQGQERQFPWRSLKRLDFNLRVLAGTWRAWLDVSINSIVCHLLLGLTIVLEASAIPCATSLLPSFIDSSKMGDVMLDNPVHTIPPHKKLPPSDSIPNIDSLEGSGNDGGDEYATLKRYQRHLEYISLQEEYIKDEQRSLKRELVRAQEEIKRIQSVPLVIGQFMEAIDQK